MYEYKIHDLVEMLHGLIEARIKLEASDSLRRPIATDKFCQNLSVVLDGVAIMSGNFDPDPSLADQIRTFQNDLSGGLADRREAVLAARTDAIIKGIENNLSLRKFMYIPADEAVYWNNTALFGENFIQTFPKQALTEMMEVGRCFAAGRGTACVFHCMRVAEYGLRKLAQKLHVSPIHKGKRYPLEYAEWDKVIDGIRVKLSAIRQRPKGLRRERALQFYSNAADHCEYMKDIWRNEMAHTRRLYKKAETLTVVNRVRDFIMLFESSRVPHSLGSSKGGGRFLK